VSKIVVPVLQLMEKNHDTNKQEGGWIYITNLQQYGDVKKLTTSGQMQATSHDACAPLHRVLLPMMSNKD
jgi:hypothetical protein